MKRLVIFLLLVVFVANFIGCASKKAKEDQLKKEANYYYKVGISYLNTGNIAEAIYNLKQSLELNPKNVDTYNALGIAYTKVNEFDKAQEYFLKAIQINPNRPDLYTNLGVLLAKKGANEEAINMFQKAIEFEEYQNKETAYYNIALAYKKLGNLKKYEENLKKAIAYNNYFLPAYDTLLTYYDQIDETQKAKNVLMQMEALSISSPRSLYVAGKIYFKEDKLGLAEKKLKKAKLAVNKDFQLKQQIDELLAKVQERKEEIEKQKKLEVARKNQILKKQSLKIKELPPPPTPIQKKTEVNQVSSGSINSAKEFKPDVPLIQPRVIKQKQEKKITKKYTKPKKKEVKKKKVIRFYIQLGTFSSKKDAIELVRKLKLYGYKPTLTKKRAAGTTYYIVSIGYFKNYAKASKFYKKKLKPIGFKGIIKFKKVEVKGNSTDAKS